MKDYICLVAIPVLFALGLYVESGGANPSIFVAAGLVLAFHWALGQWQDRR